MDKYVNVNKLMDYVDDTVINETFDAIMTIRDYLSESDADFVQIIRCKDCKHYEEMSSDSGNCYYWQIHQLANGFCECGLQKETEAKQ